MWPFVLAGLDAVEPRLEVAVRALREPVAGDLRAMRAGGGARLRRAAGAAELSSKEIEAMLTEGSPWRDLMLRFLEVASHPPLGLSPRKRVAAVRAGSGKLDMAQDFVALPGLFDELAEGLAGQAPVPERSARAAGGARRRVGAAGATRVGTSREGGAAGGGGVAGSVRVSGRGAMRPAGVVATVALGSGRPMPCCRRCHRARGMAQVKPRASRPESNGSVRRVMANKPIFPQPNVYYELAIRHAMRLPTVQIIRAQDRDPVRCQPGSNDENRLHKHLHARPQNRDI
jgi:hypothetical protein